MRATWNIDAASLRAGRSLCSKIGTKICPGKGVRRLRAEIESMLYLRAA